MRIMLPLRRPLLLLMLTLIALVALLPLRLMLDAVALDQRSLAAREARGTIWRGSLAEAQFGGVPLGDLRVGLRFWPLLLGRARINLERDDPAGLSGSVAIGRHSFGVDDVSARLDLAGAAPQLPIGALTLSRLSAHFVDGTCTRAEGQVQASSAGLLGTLLPQSTFIGSVRCDAGDLLLPLAETSGIGELNVRVSSDGPVRAELLVRSPDDLTRNRLLAAGFQLRGSGYVLAIDPAP